MWLCRVASTIFNATRNVVETVVTIVESVARAFIRIDTWLKSPRLDIQRRRILSPTYKYSTKGYG